MIKYKLICKECSNPFDSWFSSSKEYEKLKKQKFLNCQICNSTNIEKTLMSPSVLIPKSKFHINLQNDKHKKIKKKIIEYQRFIKKNFDYVGKNFAYEARSIHYKDKKVSRGIYGSATKEDIKDLKDEGIETEIMPWIKDSAN